MIYPRTPSAMNLWSEIDRLSRHSRLVLIADIVKRDRPTLSELSKAAGMTRNAFANRFKRPSRAKAAP